MTEAPTEEERATEKWFRDHERDHDWGPDYLVFNRYSFFPSTVRSRPRVNAGDVREINLNGAPPSLRVGDELLFVAAPFQELLEAFARRNALPVKERTDLWALILEPFLDTEFDEEHQARTLGELRRYGLDEQEVGRLRKRVGRRMLLVNSLLWEWVYFGLDDVLTYMQPLLFGRARYRKFYWEAMEIALRAY